MNKKIVGFGVAMTALIGASTIRPARAADTDVTLKVNNYTSVTSTPTLTMEPALSDIVTGSMEKTGVDGVKLTVTTNNSTGANVKVSAGAAGAGKIAPGDILLKSATAGTDNAFSAYNALSTTPTLLWNTATDHITGTDVDLDVKFANLANYKAVGGITTDYTNTITFTVTANS